MLKTYLARAKKKTFQSVFRLYDSIADTEMYAEYSNYKVGYDNPNYQFDKTDICFLHLPKCAGTSFAKMLKNDPQSRFKELLIHRPISPFCPPSEYRYVTIMREPTSRVWSLYKMMLRQEEGYPYRKHAKRSLEVFCQKNKAARNMVCRYLSGEMKGEPNAQTLDKAYKNLQQFYQVIDFNNFEKEAIDFLEKHGIPFKKIPLERKANYDRPSLEEYLLLQKYNEWDIRLFEKWQTERKV
jgi:transcriptional regulator with XRE-family HTH domain